ncbi:uncharacterized protein LOC143911319 [Arctopsyche grandis]|uniref:uncharacterized protein LOC143911319 n=1 Tax=Arctopsyche grandis TaxID=121162 RepID=UPI00406D8A7B
MAIIGYFAEKWKLGRIDFGKILLLCFAIIFPVTHSYAVQKNEPKLVFEPRCFTDILSKNFNIECEDVNVNDLTAMIEEEIKNSPIGKPTIDTLIIRNLSIENGKLSQNWINTTIFRISVLEIHSAKTNSIENKAFVGYAFENLHYLHLRDMKIDTLEEGTFEGLKSLAALDLSGLEVNHINENALKFVAPRLELLFVNSMVLPFNPTNLTGTVDLPRISATVMSINRMSNIDSRSFAQISNIKTVYLNWNEIESIDCGTFQKMTSMDQLSLNSNQLTTLDPCVFGDEIISNLKPYTLNLARNKWNCDCDLDWLKQLKIDNKVSDYPTCASHSDLPFEDVDFCEEEDLK